MLQLTITSQKDSSRTLVLKNPVMNAAGCFSVSDFSPYIDANILGAFVTKSITLKPREGSAPVRLFETRGGMLNSIGTENKGIDVFLKTSFLFLKNFDLPVIVSIAGETLGEYVELAKILDGNENVKALELNISCPNMEGEGIEFGKDANKTAELVRQVRSATSLPLITKLTPNVSDIAAIAVAAQDAGSDALCLINTPHGMAIDLKNKRPVLGNIHGGLSGPAIKPIALDMVWRVSHAVKVPVIGVGGIMNTEDALEFFVAGASAVQVGTANFVNPKVMEEIVNGINEYFEANGIKNFNEWIFKLKESYFPTETIEK